MTVRDIAYHLETTIGTELSHDTIIKITDEVLDEVAAWQERPLEEFYPILYLDAIVIKVRDGHQVRNKAAHMAVGVSVEGIKHVLGIWVTENEGAKRYRPLIWLLAICGLLIGEAAELRVKDLQLGRGRIRVERAVVFVGGGAPVVGPPKNGKAPTVSATPYLASMLSAAAKGRQPNDLVFTTTRGLQIRPNNFKHRDFDNAVAAVNAAAAQEAATGNRDAPTIPEGLWVHDLRHTAASWLVRSGASVKAVQRMLGHATAAITLDTYAGLFDQDLDDLAQRLQGMLVAA